MYGLDPDRFYATYFEGDEGLGLAPDEEARQFWLQYLPAERVLPGNKEDNFWEMGDTGPCANPNPNPDPDPNPNPNPNPNPDPNPQTRPRPRPQPDSNPNPHPNQVRPVLRDPLRPHRRARRGFARQPG